MVLILVYINSAVVKKHFQNWKLAEAIHFHSCRSHSKFESGCDHQLNTKQASKRRRWARKKAKSGTSLPWEELHFAGMEEASNKMKYSVGT